MPYYRNLNKVIQHFVLNLSEKLKRNIILKSKLYNARRTKQIQLALDKPIVYFSNKKNIKFIERQWCKYEPDKKHEVILESCQT